MIDEARTLEIYGYTSDELKPHSNKPIVVVCEGCGRYRDVKKQKYSVLCALCSRKNKKTRCKLSEAKRGKKNPNYGKDFSEETRRKLSEAKRGENRPPITEETRRKLSEANRNRPPKSEETRRKQSASRRGIELKDWKGYATENPYCEKFDAACRERNREKYDNQCFICGKTKEENSNRALSVHHVSRNKMEGCDGSKWQLIPLCSSCHGKAHFEPTQSRINFLLGGV